MSTFNPVVHFEMPYKDGERVAKFYTDAFGWQMRPLGKEMNDYILAQTTETDENRMIKTPGTINGGFAPRSEQYTMPSLVISVDDMEAAMKKVVAAGGKILGNPIEIPGVGDYLMFVDSEDNIVSMLKPKNM